MMYLGDFLLGQTVRFLWSSNAAGGASITRATNGTIAIHKDLGTTETSTGVTDTEDFDARTGIHAVSIVTTDAFYTAGSDYQVILHTATIDGQTVNAVLAHFSIMNRFPLKAAIRATVDNTGFSPTTTQFDCDDITEATADHYNGRSVLFTTGALLGQTRPILDYALVSGRGRFTVATLTEAPANNDELYLI
jgi:hypothetical protein